METWKAVPGYEGLYEVSDRGSVRSLDRYIEHVNENGVIVRRAQKGCTLRPGLSSNGYLTVCLRRNGKKRSVPVQWLVAEAFIGPRPPGMMVLHNDGRKTNNKKRNLRYGTRSENSYDETRLGKRKLTPTDVRRLRRMLDKGVTPLLVAARFGISQRQVYYIRSGQHYATAA